MDDHITCKRKADWLWIYHKDTHIATVYAEHGQPVKHVLDAIEKYFGKKS